jgi:hypothetical protein
METDGIQFSYNILKIEGEETEQNITEWVQNISEMTGTNMIINTDDMMKGGASEDTFFYRKFREMIEFTKEMTFSVIQEKNNAWNNLFSSANEKVDQEKESDEKTPLESQEESVRSSESIPSEVKEEPKLEEDQTKSQSESIPSEVKEEQKKSQPTLESEVKEDTPESKPITEEEQSETEEEFKEEENPEELMPPINEILQKQVSVKKLGEGTLIEILELKMVKIIAV